MRVCTVTLAGTFCARAVQSLVATIRLPVTQRFRQGPRAGEEVIPAPADRRHGITSGGNVVVLKTFVLL